MKKIVLLLVTVLTFGMTNAAELTKKDLKQIEKDAKTQCKKYEKEGWLTLPGSLPMQRQLEEIYKMRYAKENGEPIYIIKEGNSVGEVYDAAKLNAVQMAKLLIVDAIESEFAGMMVNEVNNEQMSNEEAASVEKMMSASKTKIAQQLGRTNAVVELYQKLPNNNFRVMVFIAYSGEQARKVAKKAIYKELNDESKELRAKLDKILE